MIPLVSVCRSAVLAKGCCHRITTSGASDNKRLRSCDSFMLDFQPRRSMTAEENTIWNKPTVGRGSK